MTRAYDNAVDARYPSGRRNLLINGGFDVWQRGTSFTADNVYTADRWSSADGSGGSPARTLSRQAFTVGQTDVPGEPTYYARHNQTGASTNSDSNLNQKIEGVRTGAGQSVTLSFWAKADASLNIRLRFRQNFGSSGSSTVNTNIADAFTIGTSWAKYTYTQTLPSITGKTISGGNDHLEVQLEFTNSSTFTFDIAQMQFELGNVATPFEHRSYGEELALCQRYYTEFGNHTVFAGRAYGSADLLISAVCPVPLRASPTVGGSGDMTVYGASVSDAVAMSAVGVFQFTANTNKVALDINTYSGLTDNRVANTGITNSGTLTLDAEL